MLYHGLLLSRLTRLIVWLCTGDELVVLQIHWYVYWCFDPRYDHHIYNNQHQLEIRREIHQLRWDRGLCSRSVVDYYWLTGLLRFVLLPPNISQTFCVNGKYIRTDRVLICCLRLGLSPLPSTSTLYNVANPCAYYVYPTRKGLPTNNVGYWWKM
jgi:hypothetical protein